MSLASPPLAPKWIWNDFVGGAQRQIKNQTKLEILQIIRVVNQRPESDPCTRVRHPGDKKATLIKKRVVVITDIPVSHVRATSPSF